MSNRKNPPTMHMVQPDDDVKEEWTRVYGALVDGPNSVVCTSCGLTLAGDKPVIAVECLNCFRENYIEGGA